MSFTTLTYLFYFLPLSLFLYFICPLSLKKGFLIIISLLFYGWMKPLNILYLAALILYAYFGGIFIKRAKSLRHKKIRMGILGSFLVFLLIYFKYAQGMYDLFVSLFSQELQINALIMPLGSSFILFQILSYLFDLTMERCNNTSFIDCALYISFFPKLLMGPIMQYHDFTAKNINAKLSVYHIELGARRFTIGLAQKVILADSFAQLYAALSNDYSMLGSWLSSFAYTFQIFFDFAGYTSMAIGTALMFGYHLNENFMNPYRARSIRDFWRRWHISLSTWFRDYVYIPLGGNRVTTQKHIRNILIVWLLTGIWHGNSINFLLWGLYYACLLLLETYTPLKRLADVRFLSSIITFLLVNLGWVIFSAGDLNELYAHFQAMFGFGNELYSSQSAAYFISYAMLLTLGAVLVFCPLEKWKHSLKERFSSELAVVFAYACLFITAISFLLAANYQAFLYFRF